MKTVIEMARQAWEETGEGWTVPAWFAEREKAFERFAELVRADAISDEREACAKVCEEPTEQTYKVTTSLDGFESTKQMRIPKSDRDCAAAIRARSNT